MRSVSALSHGRRTDPAADARAGSQGPMAWAMPSTPRSSADHRPAGEGADLTSPRAAQLPDSQEGGQEFKASGYDPEGYTLSHLAPRSMGAVATALKTTDAHKIAEWLRAGNPVQTGDRRDCSTRSDIVDAKYVFLQVPRRQICRDPSPPVGPAWWFPRGRWRWKSPGVLLGSISAFISFASSDVRRGAGAVSAAMATIKACRFRLPVAQGGGRPSRRGSDARLCAAVSDPRHCLR